MGCRKLILLGLALLAMTAIMTVGAQDSDSSGTDYIQVLDKVITAEYDDDVLGDGTVQFIFEENTAKLTFTDAHIYADTIAQVSNDACISTAYDLEIYLNGNNTVDLPNYANGDYIASYGIFSSGTIKVFGETATFSIESKSDCFKCTGLTVNTALLMRSKGTAMTSPLYVSGGNMYIIGNAATSSTISLNAEAGLVIRASAANPPVFGAYVPSSSGTYKVLSIDSAGTYINGTDMTNGGRIEIDENTYAEYNNENKVLTLSNFTFDNGLMHTSPLTEHSVNIGIYSSNDIRIQLIGPCIMNDAIGINVMGDISFVGFENSENSSISITEPIYSQSNLSLVNTTMSTSNWVKSMGPISMNKGGLIIMGTESAYDIVAAGDIDIRNESAIGMISCGKIVSSGNITVSNNSVLTMMAIESISASNIVVETSTLLLNMIGSGINAASNISFTNSSVTVVYNVNDPSINPVLINSGGTISIRGGSVILSIAETETEPENVIGIKGNQISISETPTLNITMSAGSMRTGICSDNELTIDVSKMTEGILDPTPALTIDMGSSTGTSTAIVSNSSKVTVTGSIYITNASADVITGIQGTNVELTPNSLAEINLIGHATPTRGIGASDTITIDSDYSVTMNIVCDAESTSVAYGMTAEHIDISCNTITLDIYSPGGSCGIKGNDKSNISADKMMITVSSDSGRIYGMDFGTITTITCNDLGLLTGTLGEDVEDVIGIKSGSGVFDISGSINLSSRGNCTGIQTKNGLTLNGSGTLSMTLWGNNVTGILVTDGSLTLNDSLSITMDLSAGDAASSTVIGIDVSTAITAGTSGTIRIKSKLATETRGIRVSNGNITVNSGTILIDCTTCAIGCATPIRATNYTASHTVEQFVSDTTKTLTPNSTKTVRFAAAVKITVESNDTDNGTVSLTEMTVPTGSVIHISGSDLTVADYTSTATPTESTTQYTYTFDGWSVDGEYTVTESMTVTAVFSKTAVPYIIRFMLNGGQCSTEPTSDWKPVISDDKVIGYSKILRYGEEIVAVPDPMKTGYTFTGWLPEVPTTMGDRSVDYVAQFTINSHTMTMTVSGVTAAIGYRLNDGEPQIYDDENPPVIEYSMKVTVIPTEMVGYTYEMFINDEPMVQTSFDMPDEEITIMVKYTPNMHQVRILLNGGHYDSTPKDWTAITIESDTIIGYVRNVNYDTPLSDILPDGPVKKGYSFTEWYKEGGVPSTMPDYNLELTAKYERLSFKVTVIITGANGSVSYKVGGGELTEYSAPFNVLYGDSVYVAANPEYQYTSALSSKDVYLDEGTFSMPDKNVTILAEYTVVKHTLSLMLNGGSAPSAPADWTPITDGKTVTGYKKDFGYDLEVTLMDDPVLAGYSFTGWDPTAPDRMPAYDVTLGATYEIRQYQITIGVSGGDAKILYSVDSGVPQEYTAPFTVYYQQKVTILPSSIEHHHTSITSNDVQITNGTFTVPSNDVTADVRYILDSFSLTLLLNTGYYTEDPEGWVRYIDEKGKFAGYTKDFGYDEQITMPSDPLLEGHTFIGWDPSVPERMPDTPLRIEARYSIAQYTVTISADPGIDMKYTIDGGSETVYSGPFLATYESYVSVIVPSKPGYTATLKSDDTDVGYTVFRVPAHDVNATLTYEVSNRLVTITTELSNAKISYKIDSNDYTPYTKPFYVKAGQSVTMISNPIEGYEKAVFSSEQTVITDGKFTMGDIDVNVYVSYIGAFFKINLSLDGGYYETDPEGWEPIINAEGTVTGYTKEFRCGSTVTLPGDPLKVGHTFSVWRPHPATMPSQNTNISAIYDPIIYTVTWYSDGEVYLKESVGYGSTIIPPADPKKTETETASFQFKQWTGFTEGMKVTGNISFSAEFTTIAKTYIVESGKTAVVSAETPSAGVSSHVIGLIQQDINNKAVDSLKISVLYGSMTVGSSAVSALKDSANISIYHLSDSEVSEKFSGLVKDRPVYEVTTDIDAKMRISLNYIIREGESSNGLFVAYLKDDGTYDRMPSSYSDGKISFDTDHNSQFAILYEKPQNDDNSDLYIKIAAGAIILILIAAFFIRRRNLTSKL